MESQTVKIPALEAELQAWKKSRGLQNLATVEIVTEEF